jgi:hypothetical protein
MASKAIFSKGMRGALVLVMLFLGSLSQAKELYEKSWAVVIGIDGYRHWPPLQAAVADATAMAQRLREMGFDTVTFIRDTEATRERILTEIGTRLSEETGPNDRVVIYFAGHGYTEDLPTGEQVGYLIPADCPQSNFFTHAISMQQIRETFSRMRAKHIYYIIDACFSGYGFTRSAGISPQARGYLKVVTEKRAVQMITAGRKGDLAHEQGGHGIFTLYVLRGLKGEADLNGDGVVTASELGAFVQPNVYQASGQKQLPQYGRLEGEGEVVFLVGEAPKIKEIKERIEALEREASQLDLERKGLEGKRELLLTDIMRLDVQLRQNKEKRELLEKELERLRSQLGPQGSPLAQSSRPFNEKEKGDTKPFQEMRPQGGRFRDMGDGTVLDTQTGLLWEKAGSLTPVRFSEAVAHVEALNRKRLGGHSDWRIPQLSELRTLVMEDASEGLKLHPIFDRRVPACWSSDHHKVGAQRHYAGVDFRDGTVLARSEHTDGYHVKAVRGPVKEESKGN